MDNNILALQKYHQEFIELVNRFPVQERLSVLFDQWSLKDILAHIIGWNMCLKENLDFIQQDKEPPFYGKVNDYNAQSVENRKNDSWEKVFKDCDQSGLQLVEAYKNLPEKYWQQKFWPEKSATPEKFLKIVTNHYANEHIPQVQMAFNKFIAKDDIK